MTTPNAHPSRPAAGLLIVPGDPAMANDLAPRLRDADRAEFAAHGREPLPGLRRCAALSDQLHAIVTSDGRPEALFGFAEVGGWARPWLLGSDELVTTHRRWFLENTPQIVQSGDARWSRFWNVVDARNTLHVRWLRWAGFTVLDAQPFGARGMLFHPLYRVVSKDSQPANVEPVELPEFLAFNAAFFNLDKPRGQTCRTASAP